MTKEARNQLLIPFGSLLASLTVISTVAVTYGADKQQINANKAQVSQNTEDIREIKEKQSLALGLVERLERAVEKLEDKGK